MPEPFNPTETLVPVFNETFAFRIGNAVFPRNDFDALKFQFENTKPERYEKPFVPAPLTVAGRRFDQCHGGVQMMYLVSGLTTQERGGPISLPMHEFELVCFSDVQKLVTARIKAIEETKNEKP